MTPVEILKAARALIDTPDKWLKGCLSQDANGKWGGSNLPYAVRFCSVGALRRASANLSFESPYYVALDALFVAKGTKDSVPTWNDRPATTHHDVLRAFDRAIALAEQKQNANPKSGRGRR